MPRFVEGRGLVVLAILILLLSPALVRSSSALATGTVATDVSGTVKFGSLSDPNISNSPDTIPFWTSSFTYNGVSYPFSIVGTDPATGSATTTIPVEIVPLAFTFSNGITLDGTPKVSSTIASPIFQDATFSSGTTQFGDAMQRAEFWNYVSTSSPGYHVLLGQPTVYPTVTISVPSNLGYEYTGPVSGKSIGVVSQDLFSPELSSIALGLHAPESLVIFLTYNVIVDGGSGSHKDCCYFGYHSVTRSVNGQGKQSVQTFIWASYTDFVSEFPILDTDVLSHEVAEWMNDPFARNLVPAWSVYSLCSPLLEVADPAGDFIYPMNGYHLQDVMFLPWFSRLAPSTSINGQYDYLGQFATFSSPC